MKANVSTFVSLLKLALSRNKSAIVVYTVGDLFTGIDFDTMIYLLILAIDRGGKSASEIIQGIYMKVTALNTLII